jgi:hypothetical protein
MPRRERKVTVSGPVASVAKSARTLGNPRSHAGALKKRPTGEPVGLVYWWSWRELNPRPQAFFAQFYMCSRLIESRLPCRAAARYTERQQPIFSSCAKLPDTRPAYEIIFAAGSP